MSMHAAPARASTVSRALARDKLGMFAVLAFILASIAPMTVAAGVIPTAYAVTGLTGIPVAFLVVAVVLALFCPGYVAMSRRIRNAGAFYAFASAGLGKMTGVAAALMALVAYESFQVATYGALGPAIAGRGRRPPRRELALVGVGAGHLGRGHRPGPGPGRGRRPDPGRADRRRDRHRRGRDHLRAHLPGRRAPGPGGAVPRRP